MIGFLSQFPVAKRWRKRLPGLPSLLVNFDEDGVGDHDCYYTRAQTSNSLNPFEASNGYLAMFEAAPKP
jgi:hypothetical protein